MVRAPDPNSYWSLSRTATYGSLMAVPLFMLYEWLAWGMNRLATEDVRNGAELLLRDLAGLLGVRSTAGFAVLLVLGAAIAVVREQRRARVPLRGRVFVGMFFESVGWALVFGTVVGGLSATVLNRMGLTGAVGVNWAGAGIHTGVGGIATPMIAVSQLNKLPFFSQLILSLGAGLYEELVFRVLLVSAIGWALARTPLGSRSATVLGVVLAAATFSLMHFMGPFRDPFALDLFMYRFVGGLMFTVIYVTRGFGIVSWTHALYDVFVIIAAL